MENYIEAMQLGAFDYLEKPLGPSEVAKLVAFHLRITKPSRDMARDGAGREAACAAPVH